MYRTLIVLLSGMLASGCAANLSATENVKITDPVFVMGKTWQWESTLTPVEKTEVPYPEHYTFYLKDDGKAMFRFDCNRGGGEYSISAGKLSFGPMMSTRMACAPDSLDNMFMKDLERVFSFFIQDGVLFLELPMDSGIMKFNQKNF